MGVVVNVFTTVAAVWDERTCEVGGGAAQDYRAARRARFSEPLLLHWDDKSAPPLLRSSPRSLLYE